VKVGSLVSISGGPGLKYRYRDQLSGGSWLPSASYNIQCPQSSVNLTVNSLSSWSSIIKYAKTNDGHCSLPLQCRYRCAVLTWRVWKKALLTSDILNKHLLQFMCCSVSDVVARRQYQLLYCKCDLCPLCSVGWQLFIASDDCWAALPR
jgi:hypothetical protein